MRACTHGSSLGNNQSRESASIAMHSFSSDRTFCIHCPSTIMIRVQLNVHCDSLIVKQYKNKSETVDHRIPPAVLVILISNTNSMVVRRGLNPSILRYVLLLVFENCLSIIVFENCLSICDAKTFCPCHYEWYGDYVDLKCVQNDRGGDRQNRDTEIKSDKRNYDKSFIMRRGIESPV